MDLPSAPWTVTHEAHKLFTTVFAPTVVSGAGCVFFGRRSKTRPKTPRAETPLRQNATVTSRANVAERSIRIETVSVAAAPRTYQHALGNRLAAISAFKNKGDRRSIAFHERSTTHLLPIELFPAGGFQGGSKLEFLRNRQEQGRTHLFGVRKSFVGIN